MSHLVKQVVLYRLSRVQSYIMIGLRIAFSFLNACTCMFYGSFSFGLFIFLQSLKLIKIYTYWLSYTYQKTKILCEHCTGSTAAAMQSLSLSLTVIVQDPDNCSGVTPRTEGRSPYWNCQE